MFKRMFVCMALGLLALPVRSQGPDKSQVELKRLQGSWSVVTLETDGTKIEEKSLKGAKIIVDGDNFTTVGMGQTYKGKIKIDGSAKPKALDMMFTEGTVKGTTSFAIYDLDGDTWKLCLTVTSADRPKEFATKAGSGHALETLKRDAGEKGQDAVKKDLDLLQGEWSMLSGEIGGQPLMPELVKGAKRLCKGNETTSFIGGQLFFKATISVDPTKKPKTIDYDMTEGPSKGKKQFGIYEFDGDKVRFCFAPPGKDRPADFKTNAGDDNTLSVWKKGKQ
jgi:uncharacterized protein (TIGR03067 family)